MPNFTLKHVYHFSMLAACCAFAQGPTVNRIHCGVLGRIRRS
jgi:hypothetical protein